MTRVERNKDRVKVVKKENRKELWKRFIMWILKNMALSLIGAVIIIYWILKWAITNLLLSLYGTAIIIYWVLRKINRIVTKTFLKLPRLAKVGLIYILLAATIFGGYSSYNVVLAKDINSSNEEKIKLQDNKIISLVNQNQKLLKENQSYVELKAELDKITKENQKLKTISSLDEIESDIYNKSIELGLNHEQAILVIAISKHETGKWTSNAFINKNNFGGVMCSTGLKAYASYNEGLNGFVTLLKNRYFDKGLDTIEKIGAVYCPVGASNDPTGVNKYWIPNVTKFYNDYLSK